ncbi:copper amine oxidase N-terminal domain-containing protein [Paenibacillus sp. R14(2021)]|uniref:copper amine oxidase N-terminal domain-containing protein n=1 Tax=Paenibacillus sp. R14(2021) TaxID=2859228 RepID=UPI001C6140C8|nr:copper amine oxidase N-terminal domain-containing protein [Paenibacillus sp. R14(2021)]
MMKKTNKIWALALLTVSIVSSGTIQTHAVSADGTYSHENMTPTIFIDGVKQDLTGFIMPSGTTLVPFRAFFDSLKIDAEFNNNTKTLLAKNDKTTIKLTADEIYGYVNDNKIKLGQSPAIVNDMFYVNLRFIAEAYGATVSFNKEDLKISISLPTDNVDIS